MANNNNSDSESNEPDVWNSCEHKIYVWIFPIRSSFSSLTPFICSCCCCCCVYSCCCFILNYYSYYYYCFIFATISSAPDKVHFQLRWRFSLLFFYVYFFLCRCTLYAFSYIPRIEMFSFSTVYMLVYVHTAHGMRENG